MFDARQNLKLRLSGTKLFVVPIFILCASVLCQAQKVTYKTCDFTEYKPFMMSHFLKAALIEQAKPLYPAAGRNIRVQGKVRVKIIVDRNGRVRAACAFEGHPLLRAAAENAARKSQFKSNFGLTLPQKRYGRRFIEDELVFNFRLE